MEQKEVNLHDFKISCENDRITVDGKSMRVIKDFEFTFKLQKTQIRAIGGAKGLCENLHRWIKECPDDEFVIIGNTCFGDPLAVWSCTVINHILKNGKSWKN